MSRTIIQAVFAGLVTTSLLAPSFASAVVAVPPGAQKCAVDGQKCALPSGWPGGHIYYGAGNHYVEIAAGPATGTFVCLPATFRIPDPVPNVQKTCFYLAAAPKPANPTPKATSATPATLPAAAKPVATASAPTTTTSPSITTTTKATTTTPTTQAAIVDPEVQRIKNALKTCMMDLRTDSRAQGLEGKKALADSLYNKKKASLSKDDLANYKDASTLYTAYKANKYNSIAEVDAVTAYTADFKSKSQACFEPSGSYETFNQYVQ